MWLSVRASVWQPRVLSSILVSRPPPAEVKFTANIPRISAEYLLPCEPPRTHQAGLTSEVLRGELQYLVLWVFKQLFGQKTKGRWRVEHSPPSTLSIAFLLKWKQPHHGVCCANFGCSAHQMHREWFVYENKRAKEGGGGYLEVDLGRWVGALCTLSGVPGGAIAASLVGSESTLSHPFS